MNQFHIWKASLAWIWYANKNLNWNTIVKIEMTIEKTVKYYLSGTKQIYYTVAGKVSKYNFT